MKYKTCFFLFLGLLYASCSVGQNKGTIHVKNALEGVPQEIRDRIIVVAVAPAAVVPDQLCFKSFNFASEKDVVYKLEPPPPPPLVAGIVDDVLVPRFGDRPLDHREELIILSAHPDAAGIDHEFQSPTFRKSLEKILAHYEKCGGQYPSEEKGQDFLEKVEKR